MGGEKQLQKVFSCLETETCFYQPGWWRTGCKDEVQGMSGAVVWVSGDLLSRWPLLHFWDSEGRVGPPVEYRLLEVVEHAFETYPMPPRGPNGLRLSPVSNRYAAYMDLTATGVLRHSECWIAATDGALPGRGVPDQDDTSGPITMGGGFCSFHLPSGGLTRSPRGLRGGTRCEKRGFSHSTSGLTRGRRSRTQPSRRTPMGRQGRPRGCTEG